MSAFDKRQDMVLAKAIRDARRAIAAGDPPTFHVKWQWDGTGCDLEILELPGVWTSAPTEADIERTVRHRIGRELGVAEDAFSVDLLGTLA